MEEEVFKSLYERPFAEQIAFNLEQLEYRFTRLSEIDTTRKENQKEYLMLFDSFLALFRALLLDNDRKTYSLQNFYRAKGQDKIAQEIDDYLDSKMFTWTDLSIKVFSGQICLSHRFHFKRRFSFGEFFYESFRESL